MCFTNILCVLAGLYSDFNSLVDLQAMTVRCKKNGEMSTLTQAALRNMIDTVDHCVFDSGYGKTFLTVDMHTLKTYTSGGGHHAEFNFLRDNLNTLANFPILWINNSPCPVCANSLIAAYADVPNKPTIYAAHFYRGLRGGVSQEQALQCLAKMVVDGFKLKPFAWNTFKRFALNEPLCIADVDTALDNDKFNQKMLVMANIILRVEEYADLRRIHCP